MNLLRIGGLGLALAAVLALFGDNRVEGQVRAQDPRRIQILQGRGAAGPLVAEEVKEKLNLTADQKEKIAKIEKEFAEKTKDATSKLQEAMQKAIQDKDRAALQKIREQMQDVQKVRGDFEAKVTAVLNAEQKQKFEEAQKTRRPIQVRPLPVQPFQRPGAGQNDLNSPQVQEKLNLTAEQKEKLEKIKKEFENKALEVLNAEQKQKFEELKKETPRPRIRPLQIPGQNPLQRPAPIPLQRRPNPDKK